MQTLSKTPGFLAFVAAVFLNSFVDLGHKIIIQNTLFKAYDGPEQVWLTAVVNALILLPFVLLFTPSGFLADRWPKNQVMRISAWAAVGITLAITGCYYLGWFEAAFAMTFVLAVQSALYSPAKFGYIKEISGAEGLTQGNAWVQGSSSTAILAGILVFSVLFEAMLDTPAANHGLGMAPDEIVRQIAPVGWFLVLGSLIEVWLIHRMPTQRGPQEDLRFDRRRYLRGQYLAENLRAAWSSHLIWLPIVGLGVFWGIAQVLLAVFPAFVEETTGVTNTVIIQGLMAFSGIGIIIGAALAGRIARDHIEMGLIPIAAIGISVVLLLMPVISHSWLHGLNFLALGIMAGLFIVPLNALIQFNAAEEELGRVLAAKNFVLHWIMLGALAVTLISALTDHSSRAIMLGLAVFGIGAALFTLYQLPQSLVRILLSWLFATRYRLRVTGLDHLPARGGVLLLGNHLSLVDWAIVQMACPRAVRFVIERSYYRRWYLRGFMDFFGVVPASRGGSRDALEAVGDLLRQGRVVCLFPEGRPYPETVIGPFRRGFEHAVAGSGAVILPFYLQGLWGSRFAHPVGAHTVGAHRASPHPDSIDQRPTHWWRRPVRRVRIAFGAPLADSSRAEAVRAVVVSLAEQSHSADANASIPRSRVPTGIRGR